MTGSEDRTSAEPELTSVEYEELTRQIVETLSAVEGVETIRVEHDVVLPGKVHDHQIDVVWDYERNGGRERVVFECRRFKQNLKNTHVWAFKGIVGDLAEPAKGVMVTQEGFQKAALQVGEAHDIDLWTLRKPKDSDWDGRLRDVEIRGVPTKPVVTDLDLDVDTSRTSGSRKKVEGNQDSRFVQPDGVEVRLGDVIGDWLEDVGFVESVADLVSVRRDFPDGTVLVVTDGTEVPVGSMSGRVGLVPDEEAAIDVGVRGDDLVAFVLHRLFGDRRFLVEADGTIREVDRPPPDGGAQ